MGIAAYNRGTAAMNRDADAACREVRNTMDAKARLWANLAAAGRILTFRVDGRAVTFGPYQLADGSREFAAIEHGGRRRECVQRLPWHAACVLVSWVGRLRPVSIN